VLARVLLDPVVMQNSCRFVSKDLGDLPVQYTTRSHFTNEVLHDSPHARSLPQVNPHIRFEVFIHKVDGLSDDHKIETTRDIHQRVCRPPGHAPAHPLRIRFAPSCWHVALRVARKVGKKEEDVISQQATPNPQTMSCRSVQDIRLLGCSRLFPAAPLLSRVMPGPGGGVSAVRAGHGRIGTRGAARDSFEFSSDLDLRPLHL
jgi:hypothetical protein